MNTSRSWLILTTGLLEFGCDETLDQRQASISQGGATYKDLVSRRNRNIDRVSFIGSVE